MTTNVQIVRGIESLFGTRDENIRLLETGLNVKTHLVDNSLEVHGEPSDVLRAENFILDYQALVREGSPISESDLHNYLKVISEDPGLTLRALVASGKQRNFGKKILTPKTLNQRRYMEAIDRNDLVFGVGPAGTGKHILRLPWGSPRSSASAYPVLC